MRNMWILCVVCACAGEPATSSSVDASGGGGSPLTCPVEPGTLLASLHIRTVTITSDEVDPVVFHLNAEVDPNPLQLPTELSTAVDAMWSCMTSGGQL